MRAGQRRRSETVWPFPNRDIALSQRASLKVAPGAKQANAMRSSLRNVFAVLVGLSAIPTLGIPAKAQQTASWNGTWIGNWSGGNSTQIVFADNELIAIYWDGDYLSETQSSLSANGKIVTITWQSGQALLTRDGETSGHILVQETGRPDIAFDVKRDD